MRQTAVLAIPSLISLSRVVLAAAFIVESAPWVRASLVVASAFSDFLDGWIARTHNLETRVGALIDPITDRLFVLITIAVLLSDGALTPAQCLLLLMRDIATTVGFIVARIVSWLRPVAFQARLAGKVVTVLQFLALISALLRPAWVSGMVLLVAAVSVFAIADYTLALWRARATA